MICYELSMTIQAIYPHSKTASLKLIVSHQCLSFQNLITTKDLHKHIDESLYFERISGELSHRIHLRILQGSVSGTFRIPWLHRIVSQLGRESLLRMSIMRGHVFVTWFLEM